jgi:glucose-6-phosphate 1-dehydrogenase
VIFGASGDLTHRKLIPALFELFRQRRLPSEFAVLGCARRPWSDEEFRQRMAEAMASEVAEHRMAWEQFAAGLFYEPVDLQDPPTVVQLGQRLEAIDRQRATRGNRTFYLSVSPTFYGSGCRALAAAGLLSDPARSRVVIEKPFGRDYGSAQELNRVVQASAQENQIFRIDHYLGKETVQNILVLRFANTIFEPIWNRNYISCGTWCRTTSPRCSPSPRWRRRVASTPSRCATRRPRCCRPRGWPMRTSPGSAACGASTAPAAPAPGRSPATARSRG